jgi:hypothetical protein
LDLTELTSADNQGVSTAGVEAKMVTHSTHTQSSFTFTLRSTGLLITRFLPPLRLPGHRLKRLSDTLKSASRVKSGASSITAMKATTIRASACMTSQQEPPYVRLGGVATICTTSRDSCPATPRRLVEPRPLPYGR